MSDCIRELNCPAQTHYATCPWHPANVQHTEIPADMFDTLMTELELEKPRLHELLEPYRPPANIPLTRTELREVDNLFALRNSEITFQNRATALQMRYNFNRWHLIIEELAKRLRENPNT